MPVNISEAKIAASASRDLFLKLDGIGGEARDEEHAGEIQIDGWSFGVNDEAGDEDGERVSGGRGDLPRFRMVSDIMAQGNSSVRVGDVHVVKRIDAASAPLMKASTTRQKIAKAILTCRKASGAEGLEYLQIQLQDVMVNRWQIGTEGNELMPVEKLVLSYARIEFTYQPQGRKGTSEGKKMAGWDRKLNAPL